MVVAGSKGVEVVETVDGHGVFWCIVTDSSGVAGDLSISDIVRSLSTKEETIATKDGVSSESGTLDEEMKKKSASRDYAYDSRGRGIVTLNTSKAPRVWTPDCL